MVTEFPLHGEPLAVDLANTVVRHRGREVDLLADPGGRQAWRELQGDRLPAAAADSEALVALRDALRELFAAATSGRPAQAHSVALVNRHAARAELVLEQTASGPRPRWTVRDRDADLGLAAVARSAVAVLGGDLGSPLRACANPACVLFFATGDSRRRFCSARTCANRARQARHRKRHAT